MSVNIRYPNITGLSEKEQLAQIKSYLYHLVEQLNYTLAMLGDGTATGTSSSQEGGLSYYEVQSIIGEATTKLKNQYEKLYERLENDYVSNEEFAAIVAEVEALKEAIENIGGGGGSGVDFVTEIGTADGWSYKKWNSGTYEMFGAFTMTTTTPCTDMGSMFCSEEFTLPIPFAIETAIVSGSADDLFLVTSGGRASVDADNNIGFVLLRHISFDSGMDIAVRLHVTGTVRVEQTI